jgi:hypothetical protein
MFLKSVVVVAAAAVTLSCATGANGTGVLAPADPRTAKPSSYQPERPFAALGDGAMARPIFRTDTGAPYGAEIHDLLVAPGKSATLAHDGVALVDTRDGAGGATIGDRQVKLEPGVTFGLSQGQTAVVQNGGRAPLVLRVYVVTVR